MYILFLNSMRVPRKTKKLVRISR